MKKTQHMRHIQYPVAGKRRRTCIGDKWRATERSFDLGKVDYTGSGRRDSQCTVEVTEKDDGQFSATCTIWNRTRTCFLVTGQAFDTMAKFRKDFCHRSKWLFDEVCDLWRKYHLEGTRAGTPEQLAAIKDWTIKSGKSFAFSHDDLCAYLKKRGLYMVPDPEFPGEMFEFGTRWLRAGIPDEDRVRIQALLDGDVETAVANGMKLGKKNEDYGR